MGDPGATVPITLQMLSVFAAVAVGTATVVMFLMREFSKNRRLFYRIISLHNKEDDDRFAELSDSIWNIHLRNAQRDGQAPPVRKSFPRRRYLVEDGDVEAAVK